MEDITEYREYVSSFRKHFMKVCDQDPLRAMVKFLSTNGPAGESYTQYISKLDLWCRELLNTIQNSQWKVQGNPNFITLPQALKLVAFSKLIQNVDGLSAERLYKDLNENHKIGETDYFLRGYSEVNPGFNPHVMTVKSTSRSPSPGHRASRSISRNRNPTENRARNATKTRYVHSGNSQVQCYKCYTLGHVATYCSSYIVCGNCQYDGHHESEDPRLQG